MELQIWLGVDNFAKIEHAKININRYTLLVGPNNCGKTFLMQLAQGVGEKLTSLMDEDIFDALSVQEIAQRRDCRITADSLPLFVDYINKKLDAQKDRIVREIFGKEIPVGRLYIDMAMEAGSAYEIIVWKNSAENQKSVREIMLSGPERIKNLIEKMPEKARCCILVKEENGIRKIFSLSVSFSSPEIEVFKAAMEHIVGIRSLFLPASRAGLMLLYREFFANKTDNAISYRVEDGEVLENKPDYGGLTQPIYSFLRFLQTYSEDETAKGKYQEELKFFENALIEGQIEVSEQGNFSYCSVTDSGKIPMYLASSMINEVAPLELAIISSDEYQRLIIDEVEASLHPEKQLELVRFLNRLSNKNVKLILSTHSDTFVSKMNNLYILSQMVNDGKGEKTIQALGLERADLIDPERLFVYEFVGLPDGKYAVKEITGNKKTGFQFDLFTKSAMRLYEEALALGEIQKDDQTQF